jgi:acetylornithine deacetylase/succinyl-diaminopimelate desuccinylase-like protein
MTPDYQVGVAGSDVAAVPRPADLPTISIDRRRLWDSFVRSMSGAGHDAQEISAICPTAMVFVAGENGGISHTPGEYSNPEACGSGIDMLANAVLRLAQQP